MLRVASRGVAAASRGAAAAAAAAAIGSRRAICTEGPASVLSLRGTSLDGGEMSFACLAGKPALVLNVASE